MMYIDIHAHETLVLYGYVCKFCNVNHVCTDTNILLFLIKIIQIVECGQWSYFIFHCSALFECRMSLIAQLDIVS